MKITLVMVQTADGKTTRWQDAAIHGWASEEDHAHFHTLIANTNVLVMGRKTYESVTSEIKLSPNILRIVLTQRPDDFCTQRTPQQLEFTDESPAALVKRLGGDGYTSLLLAGGSEVNEAFLSAKLITDCLITIEPRFFGSGKSLFAPVNVDIPLKLIDVKKLNTQGTLILHYTVDYDHTTA